MHHLGRRAAARYASAMTRCLRASITALLSAVSVGACASSYVAVGADAGTPSDASVAPPASTAPPPSDGAPPPPPVDAAVDGAPGTPCAAGHTHYLCADFDTTKLESFGGTRVDAPGLLDTSTAFSVSGNRSLLATLPRRGASAGDVFVRAEKILVGWRRVRMDFDIRLETADFQPSDSGLSLAGIFMTSSTSFTGTLLFTDGVSTAVSIESQSTRYVETKGHLAPKKWIHVMMDFDPTRGRYELAIDGKPESLTFPVTQRTGLTPETEFSVGISSFEGPSPNLGVHYDNVVIDLL